MFLWKQSAKQFIVIGLMLSLVAPLLFGGISFIYHRNCNRHAIRKVLKSNLADAELTFFTFSIKDVSKLLDWKREDEEFLYKGNMYDVVDADIRGDSILYRCWKDEKDTQLYCHLDQLTVVLLAQDNPLQKQQKQFINFIKNFFYNTFKSLKLTEVYKEKQLSFFGYVNHYVSFNIHPPSPPPQGY